MSYKTKFRLEIQNRNNPLFGCIGKEDFEDYLIFKLRKNFLGAKYALTEKGNTLKKSNDWVLWKEDMISFSQEYKNVLFKLHLEGEDQGDLTDAYFLNGRYQLCPAKIVYQEFDENTMELL